MTPIAVDRPAAIRHALRQLVADNGFHGTSMQSVAKEAGVAAGTAYVHYESKEDLVFATYREIKVEMGRAALVGFDPTAPSAARFRHLLKACHGYLTEDRSRAKFLGQIEESPFYGRARAGLEELGDPLAVEAARLEQEPSLIGLPSEVIHAMSFNVIVRLVANGIELSEDQVDELVDAMWRGITR